MYFIYRIYKIDKCENFEQRKIYRSKIKINKPTIKKLIKIIVNTHNTQYTKYNRVSIYIYIYTYKFMFIGIFLIIKQEFLKFMY